MSEKDVVLYGLTTCTYCRKVREILDQLGVNYKAVDLDLLSGNEKAQVLMELGQYNPKQTFPTTVVGEQVITGFREQELKDALGITTEVDLLYDRLRQIQEPQGYFFNNDREHTFGLLRALFTNKDRYGYMSCPCRLAAEEREKDKDIICPCVYREPDVQEYDSCYCGLYVSAAWNERGIERRLVPERRKIIL